MRFLIDRRRSLVFLMLGNECVEQMRFDEYTQLFGLRAFAKLACSVQPLDDVIDPRD